MGNWQIYHLNKFLNYFISIVHYCHVSVSFIIDIMNWVTTKLLKLLYTQFQSLETMTVDRFGDRTLQNDWDLELVIVRALFNFMHF